MSFEARILRRHDRQTQESSEEKGRTDETRLQLVTFDHHSGNNGRKLFGVESNRRRIWDLSLLWRWKDRTYVLECRCHNGMQSSRYTTRSKDEREGFLLPLHWFSMLNVRIKVIVATEAEIQKLGMESRHFAKKARKQLWISAVCV